MATLIIDISNHPLIVDVKRKVIIHQYTKSYTDELYTMPYTIEHYDPNDEKLDFIPDYTNVLHAANSKTVYVNNQFQAFDDPFEGALEMGYFNYFQELQKMLPDQAILTTQISDLDAKGQFNTY